MQSIGIIGGGNISRMGAAHEVDAFFKIIEKYCGPQMSPEKLEPVTKVLYSGNVKPEQFQILEKSWNEVFEILKHIPGESEDYDLFKSRVASEKVDFSAKNLSDFFSEYKKILNNALSGANFSFVKYQYESRIRIGVTEVPHYLETENRSDMEYDTLNGPPFWMRSSVD